MGEITKQCVTCGKKGHTYLECDKVDFFELLGAALGVSDILSNETMAERDSRVSKQIEALNYDGVTMEERKALLE